MLEFIFNLFGNMNSNHGFKWYMYMLYYMYNTMALIKSLQNVHLLEEIMRKTFKTLK